MKKQINKLQLEFRKQGLTAIIAAFGFLIAFSWRDFISISINQLVSFLGADAQLYLYKLLSAIIITIICVVGIIVVTKLKLDKDKK